MAKDAKLTAKKLINLDPAMVAEVDKVRHDLRIETESETIRQLLRKGLDLPSLCIDLLDAIEMQGLLNVNELSKAVRAMEDFLQTKPSNDFRQWDAAEFENLQKTKGHGISLSALPRETPQVKTSPPTSWFDPMLHKPI
jgi:hypothetical protein